MPERIKHPPLDEKKTEPLKAEIYLITDECKGCGYCIEFCPKKVLEESQDINARGVHPPRIVDESKCALCGFCTAVCPDFAIYVAEKSSKEDKKA
ncbi:MAG TPA: 4Fe-4S binding protein [Candidatus Acidoferrum sp.]|jgi:2-oxoglutarate ferredoxin oxidoreductase subunit delta|nr:4Fe-4S binding protein [Candidatus Acidoferrum sp.]